MSSTKNIPILNYRILLLSANACLFPYNTNSAMDLKVCFREGTCGGEELVKCSNVSLLHGSWALLHLQPSRGPMCTVGQNARTVNKRGEHHVNISFLIQRRNHLITSKTRSSYVLTIWYGVYILTTWSSSKVNIITVINSLFNSNK